MAQNGSTSASVVIGAKTVDALTQLKKLSGELRTLRQEIKDFNAQKVANPFSASKPDPQIQMWKTQAADAARLETILSSNHAKSMRRGEESVRQNRALSASSQEMHAALRGASGAVGLLWMTYSRYIPAMAAGFLSVAGTVGTMNKSIREGMDFDYQTRFVSAVDDNPDNTSKSVQAGLIENTKDSIFNLNENARALRVLSQTGVDAATGVKLLSTTMKAATLGETEMRQAAEDLTSTLVVFNLASKNSDEYASNYKRAGDITAWVAKETKANFSEVSKSLQGVVGVAREYGVTLEEVAAMTVMLGKQGIVGSRAGTYERSAIESLYVPTSKQAEKLFKELKFSAFDQVTKEPKAFAEVLQDLVGRLKTLNKEAQSNAIAKIFPAWGAKAFRTANEDLDEFLSMLTKTKTATGELDGAFTKLSASYKIQIDQLKADWDNAFTLAFEMDDGDFKEVISEIRTILQSPEFIDGLKAMVKLGVDVILGTAKAGVEVYKVGQATSEVSQDLTEMMRNASASALKLGDDFFGISSGISETRTTFSNFVKEMDQAKTTGGHPQGIIGTILFNAFDFRNYGKILDQIKGKVKEIVGLSSNVSRLDELNKSIEHKRSILDTTDKLRGKLNQSVIGGPFQAVASVLTSATRNKLEAEIKERNKLLEESMALQGKLAAGPVDVLPAIFDPVTRPSTSTSTSTRGTGTLRDTEADRAAESARTKAANQYENLDSRLRQYLKSVEESVESERKVTEGEKLSIALKDEYGQKLERLGPTERAHQLTQLKQIEIYEDELRKREELRNYQRMDSEFNQTLQQTIGAEKSRAQQLQAQLDFKKELNDAQRAELQILVEQVRVQERLNILKDAQREVEDSAIGSMRIDRERERAQIEANHRRRVEDIKLQEAGGRDPSMVAADMEAENIKYTEQIRQYTLKWEGSFADGVDRAFANYINSVGTMADQSERLFASTMGNLEDELFKFVKTGKFSFESLSESFIDELIKMEIRMAASEVYKMLREGATIGSSGESSGGGGGGLFGDIVSSVGDWFSGLDLFAKGGVPGGKGISAYSNKIVNSPTIFPFARGTGLMGEAGPEAIMPLTRVNGKLGVQAIGGSGGGSNVQVNIINNGNSQVKTQERQQGNSRIIDVMIEQVKDAVAQDINSGRGSVSSALNKTFQLSRVPSSF